MNNFELSVTFSDDKLHSTEHDSFMIGLFLKKNINHVSHTEKSYQRDYLCEQQETQVFYIFINTDHYYMQNNLVIFVYDIMC